MTRYIFLRLVSLIISLNFIQGQRFPDDPECRREHGVCTKHIYENRRLAALRSSGCKSFCQCAHASTELDGSVTYMWVRQECPPTTLFDDSLPSPVCNHEYKVQCYGEYDGLDCRQEHGICTQFIYENVRLIPQKSSGCKRFCQCAHASTELDGTVTYKWVEHTCPEGTLFDSRIRVCNHERNVQCDGFFPQKEPYITEPPVIYETTTRAKDCEERIENDECYKEYGSCSLDQYENVRLVALRRSGCKNFCQCAHASTEIDGSVTYKWAKKTCPKGTLFDESLPAPICNHEYNVQCPDDDSKGCTDEHGICTEYIYENIRLVPKRSSDCEQFCQCAYASTELDGSVTFKWVEHDCPAGTLFDPDLRVCNFAEKVKCHDEQDNGDKDCRLQHGRCNKETYEDIRLAVLKGSDCEEFCQCEHESTRIGGSVTYRWAKHRCPPGTLFDDSLKVCNHAYQVRCDDVDNDNCKEHKCGDSKESGTDDNERESTDSDGDNNVDDNDESESAENGDENNPDSESEKSKVDHVVDSDASSEEDDGNKDPDSKTEGDETKEAIDNDSEVKNDNDGKSKESDNVENSKSKVTNVKSGSIESTTKSKSTKSKSEEESASNGSGSKSEGKSAKSKSTTDETSNDIGSKDESKSEKSKHKSKTSKSEKSKSEKSKSKSNTGKSKIKSEKSKDKSGKSKIKSKKSKDKSEKSKIKSEKSKDISENSKSKSDKRKSKNEKNTSKGETSKSKESKGQSKKSKSKSEKSKSNIKNEQDKDKSVKSKSKHSKGKSEKSKGKSEKSKSKSDKSKRGNNDADAEFELQEVSQVPFQCYKCDNRKTNVACNEQTETCPDQKQSCQTIVDWRGDSYEVRKGCKTPAYSSNTKLGCERNGSGITCYYECADSLCNGPLPAIILYD